MVTPADLAAALGTYEQALARLADALQQPPTEWVCDAAIQRFEFCFELAWKTVARFAHREGLDTPSPRQAFTAALRLGWLEDEPLWLDIREDRNRASHVYGAQMAAEIFKALPRYLPAMQRLAVALRQQIS